MSKVSLLPIVSLHRCLLPFVSIELSIKCQRTVFFSFIFSPLCHGVVFAADENREGWGGLRITSHYRMTNIWFTRVIFWKDFDRCNFTHTWLMKLYTSLNYSCFLYWFTSVLGSKKSSFYTYTKLCDVAKLRRHVYSISRSAADVPYVKTRVGVKLNNESNKTKLVDQVEGNVALNKFRKHPQTVFLCRRVYILIAKERKRRKICLTFLQAWTALTFSTAIVSICRGKTKINKNFVEQKGFISAFVPE